MYEQDLIMAHHPITKVPGIFRYILTRSTINTTSNGYAPESADNVKSTVNGCIIVTSLSALKQNRHHQILHLKHLQEPLHLKK